MSRIPVDDGYLLALGLATYNFAYLEWGIIWIGEKVEQGFLKRSKKWTAKTLASKFLVTVERGSVAEVHRSRARKIGEAFLRLVDERNRLLHAHPFTSNTGEQQLAYGGNAGDKVWKIDNMKDAAQEFENLAIEATSLIHQF